MTRPMRLLALLLISFTAVAQEWPAKPVRIVVPFPPGGAADAMPRIVAEKLAEKWKQPFIIENRAGATGTIGAEIVYRAEPDGYTVLSTPPAPLVINPSLYLKLPYDAAQFVPVGVIGSIPSVMLVNPKVGAQSVREFVEHARANPGRLNYASQGTTSVSFLTTEMFLAAAGGLKITQVPYKGTAPALAATMAGETELFFDNLGTSLAQVRSGRLKALAVCGERRHPALPDVPAMSEIYPGFVSVAWFGVVAPPRTPPAIADRLAAGIAEALKMPDVQKRLADLSAEPIGMGPAEMAKFMKEEAARWREAIRFAGLKPE
ncbi:MAG TPA: tripartite tricarboxylate transporter substrate binding protein [Burkholderiales bacterium]|nr:tripartite tricarboxylate transporter substrate binding protein [Burkholderiales bacterium]